VAVVGCYSLLVSVVQVKLGYLGPLVLFRCLFCKITLWDKWYKLFMTVPFMSSSQHCPGTEGNTKQWSCSPGL